MKEELTTKMHSEFKVSPETQLKHRVFTLLSLTGTEDINLIKRWMPLYDVTITDVEKYKQAFKQLSPVN